LDCSIQYKKAKGRTSLVNYEIIKNQTFITVKIKTFFLKNKFRPDKVYDKKLKPHEKSKVIMLGDEKKCLYFKEF